MTTTNDAPLHFEGCAKPRDHWAEGDLWCGPPRTEPLTGFEREAAYYAGQLVNAEATITDLLAKLNEAEESANDWEQIFFKQRERERPYIELWRKREDRPLSLPDYGSMLEFLIDMIDLGDAVNERIGTELSKAEATAKKLREALGVLIPNIRQYMMYQLESDTRQSNNDARALIGAVEIAEALTNTATEGAEVTE